SPSSVGCSAATTRTRQPSMQWLNRGLLLLTRTPGPILRDAQLSPTSTVPSRPALGKGLPARFPAPPGNVPCRTEPRFGTLQVESCHVMSHTGGLPRHARSPCAPPRVALHRQGNTHTKRSQSRPHAHDLAGGCGLFRCGKDPDCPTRLGRRYHGGLPAFGHA